MKLQRNNKALIFRARLILACWGFTCFATGIATFMLIICGASALHRQNIINIFTNQSEYTHNVHKGR